MITKINGSLFPLILQAIGFYLNTNYASRDVLLILDDEKEEVQIVTERKEVPEVIVTLNY